MPSRTEANGTDKLIYYLDLNELGLSDVPDEQKEAAKKEVASYLEETVLRTISRGESPVSGMGRFPILNEDYAKREKNGQRRSDLELHGDLKDSLIVKPHEDSYIKYGHEGDQVPKSDGHNQISLKAKTWAKSSGMKRRRYIPDEGQKFDGVITDGIEKIISSYKTTAIKSRNERNTSSDNDYFFSDSYIDSTIETPDKINVSTSDLFSDDVIESLLADAFRRRGL